MYVGLEYILSFKKPVNKYEQEKDPVTKRAKDHDKLFVGVLDFIKPGITLIRYTDLTL